MADTRMNKSESEILKEILVAASRAGCRLFRNQVGLFFTKDGRPVHVGTVGTPDLWGWAPGGRALHVEVKSAQGRLRKAQEAFGATSRAAGCLHIVARSVDEFLGALHVDRLQSGKEPTQR